MQQPLLERSERSKTGRVRPKKRDHCFRPQNSRITEFQREKRMKYYNLNFNASVYPRVVFKPQKEKIGSVCFGKTIFESSSSSIPSLFSRPLPNIGLSNSAPFLTC